MQQILNKIQVVLLILIAVTLPFNIEFLNLNSLSVLLIAANSLVIMFTTGGKFKLAFSAMFIAFVSFFIMHLIGALYSENTHEAGFAIEKKLSLMAFPIIFFYTPKLHQNQFKQVLKSFVISCVITCCVALSIALVKFYHTHDSELFYYHSLSTNVGMHAGYLAMYLCFALSILMYIYFAKDIKQTLAQMAISVFAVIVLCTTIIFLASRMQILLMMGLWLMFFVYRFQLQKSPIKLIVAAFVIVTVLFSVILLSPKNRERFKEAINYKGEYALSKKWGEKQMRFLMWSSAIDLIKEKPLIGYGTGDVQDELEKHYIAHDYVSLTYWKNTRFNAHNQFLETSLAIGLLGLCVFITGIVFALNRAVKTKNRIYIAFMIVFLCSCLTESMLERQNGIVFFAFFNSFLIMNSANEKGTNKVIPSI